jgi:hypothetical protein
LGATSCFARSLNRWQQQRDEDSDDYDHDQ